MCHCHIVRLRRSGQDNYLLGVGVWRHALLTNQTIREQARAAAPPLPPLGQGIFSPSLVPGPTLHVNAVALSPAEWGERTPLGPRSWRRKTFLKSQEFCPSQNEVLFLFYVAVLVVCLRNTAFVHPSQSLLSGVRQE